MQWIVLLCACLSLLSCAVGPDFHSPPPPQTTSYTGAPQPKKTISTPAAGQGGQSQTFIHGADLPAEWWRLFHSPELDQLIHIGLANSPNLAAAKAALRQSQEIFNAQVGTSLFPNFNAQFSGERQSFSNSTLGVNTPSRVFNLFNASVTMSYTLDIFGGARRELESLCAQVNYQRYQLEAAYITLTSNIVTTSIMVASFRAQIAATEELIAFQVQQLNVMRKQFNLGAISSIDLLAQQTEVEQTRATLPPLQQSLARNLHALSVLIGSLPDENQIPKFVLNKLTLPTHLPISIPSRLTRQRPDVQAAEALLHAASAKIGVATANLYPQLTINASYGWESTVASDLFKPMSSIWTLGPTLTQPIFYGGALRARRRAAIAAYEQACAQYRQTVLVAFQNVADTLRALEHDAKTLQAQKAAEIAARRALLLTQEQYRLGGVNYLALLIAQRQYQQAKIGQIRAMATRYSDTAALFQALGGGWWNRGCPFT